MLEILGVILACEIVILLTFGSQSKLYRWLWEPLKPLFAQSIRLLKWLVTPRQPAEDPAPVATALQSVSLRDITQQAKQAGGEVKKVPRAESRDREAQ